MTMENTAETRMGGSVCEFCPHTHGGVEVDGTVELKEALAAFDSIPGTGGPTMPSGQGRFNALSKAERTAALDRLDGWQAQYAHLGLSYQAHCGGAWAYRDGEWVQGH